MTLSWSAYAAQCKSPVRVLGAMLLQAREYFKLKCQGLSATVERLRQENSALQQTAEACQRENAQLRCENRRLQTELGRFGCRLPADPPLPRHTFGPRLMAVSVNIARLAGLRGAEKILQLFFQWLGAAQKAPDCSTIRVWMQRAGVAELQAESPLADDLVWLVDHTNQIGQEKVLVVLGVRASQLPPPGQPLQHEHLRVLAVQPGVSWKEDDMNAVFETLTAKHGVPRAILSDEGADLKKAAQTLTENHPGCVALHDFKHRAANRFKGLIGNQERFRAFAKHLGQTRCAVQQTELAHLAPPAARAKARFMNLAPALDWAAQIQWLLDAPQAQSRQYVSAARLEEKLGWLRSFRRELAEWRECQRVISQALTFINERGLYQGAARDLHWLLAGHTTCGLAQRLRKELTLYVYRSEAHLKPGERLPLSTEILESSFAVYKAFEGQHSRGGFTSLLPAFAALLKPATPSSIRRAFAAVKQKDVAAWVQTHLGPTVAARRRRTRNEFRAARRSAGATSETTAS